jgi:hypothetical protein
MTSTLFPLLLEKLDASGSTKKQHGADPLQHPRSEDFTSHICARHSQLWLNDAQRKTLYLLEM